MSCVSVECIAVCYPDTFSLPFCSQKPSPLFFFFVPLHGHELKNGNPISSPRSEPWLVKSNQLGLIPFGSGYFIYCHVTNSWSMQPKKNSTCKLLWEIFLTMKEMKRNAFFLLPWITVYLHTILELLQPFCHHEERYTAKEKTLVFISCHCK